ncbi:hypothetical protein HY624_03810 [Candidatus Uhrbacteria bacterium]|nr:hypothetical protein [Candidatus Uhrbacteria bacterium]
MTFFDWGLLGVFFLSAIIFIVLLLRHISQLVVIDLTTIAKEREARVRERLLRERIARQFGRLFQWRPIHALAHRMDRFAHHLEPQRSAALGNGAGAMVTLQNQAFAAFRDKQYSRAEEYTVELIRQHPEYAHAYALLGRIKHATHALADARDALRFAVRLAEREASSGFISEGIGDGETKQVRATSDRELALMRYDLAHVMEAEGDGAHAAEQLESALLLLPNDPKILDALLSVAILVKKKELAEETLAQLRAVNPENEKLGDFADQVEALGSLKKKKK